LIEPVLRVWRAARQGPGTAARVHDLREIVNAIVYVCRTGIAWEYLPHDFPPYKTVHDYYAKWEADGTAQKVHDLLRERVRVSKGRDRAPTAAIIDAQSVKTSCNVAESSQGIDAGKKIKGRKRHLATDTLGLVIAVLVTAASVQDSAGNESSSRPCWNAVPNSRPPTNTSARSRPCSPSCPAMTSPNGSAMPKPVGSPASPRSQAVLNKTSTPSSRA
jgi:transposase